MSRLHPNLLRGVKVLRTITPLLPATTKLMQDRRIFPYRFTLILDYSDPDFLRNLAMKLSFIAQDIGEKYPRRTLTGKDTKYLLQYVGTLSSILQRSLLIPGNPLRGPRCH